MHSSTKTKSLFLNGESSLAVLAEIVGTIRYIEAEKNLDRAARYLIALARDARMLREPELCERASGIVLSLDISPSIRAAAEYYKSQREPYDQEGNRANLIHLADTCNPDYLPRIILEIGKSYHSQDNHSEALRYYIEAAKAARHADALSHTQALWNVAMLDYDSGQHKDALKKFEALFPAVKSLSHRYPVLYYDYLNNLAALLNKGGRVQEARYAVKIALASPLAYRFPEWLETQKEIEEAAQKEPQRRPATATVVAIAASRARPRKAPARATHRVQKTSGVIAARLDQAGTFILLIFPDADAVSLLKRYVKSVRIRQP
jgi:hypothetical protein